MLHIQAVFPTFLSEDLPFEVCWWWSSEVWSDSVSGSVSERSGTVCSELVAAVTGGLTRWRWAGLPTALLLGTPPPPATESERLIQVFLCGWRDVSVELRFPELCKLKEALGLSATPPSLCVLATGVVGTVWGLAEALLGLNEGTTGPGFFPVGWSSESGRCGCCVCLNTGTILAVFGVCDETWCWFEGEREWLSNPMLLGKPCGVVTWLGCLPVCVVTWPDCVVMWPEARAEARPIKLLPLPAPNEVGGATLAAREGSIATLRLGWLVAGKAAVWSRGSGVSALLEYLMGSPHRLGILECRSLTKQLATECESLLLATTMGGAFSTQHPG